MACLGNGVDIRVWLPRVENPGNSQKFPVVYLHDGCRIFGLDEANPQPGSPRIQDVLHRLSNEKSLPPSAIVSMDYPVGETADGIPVRSQILSLERDGRDFSRWLACELVPEMEAKYPLLAGAENRTLIGTGLAALNGLDLALREFAAFRRYGCLSTSFEDISMQIPARCAMLLRLEDGAAPHAGARLCFDYGTEGLDECYEPYHRELSALLRNRAEVSGVEFSVLRAAGGTHDAGSWRNRLETVLRSLFDKAG
jgi:enterochelin esterase-like enzyme